MALFSAAERQGSRVCRFVPTLSICASGLLLAGGAFAGSNTFTSVGPHGGSVYRVTYHPSNASIVYATATSGFHRSTDGGATWQVINDRIYNQARDIAVNPAHPNNVFTISPSSGVLSSDDSGATLTVLSTFPAASTGMDIEYSADGSMLYASNGLRIYRSSNQGDSWIEGAAIPGITARTYPTLTVDPTNPTTLYVTGDAGEGAQSTDGGATWQPWPLPTGQVNQIAIVTQPLRIWAATTTGTWFTDDRGQHWTQAHTSIAQAVTVDPSDTDVVYIGTLEGLYRSVNNGGQWTYIPGNNACGQIMSIAVDPANSQHLLLAGYNGVVASTDGGASWTARNQGIDALNSYELAYSPAMDRVYVGTLYEGPFAIQASDHASFALNDAQLRSLGGFRNIYAHGLYLQPGTQDRLLTGITQGIARSTDAGATWSLLSNPLPSFRAVRGIVAGSSSGSTLLAASSAELFRSLNGGNNWQASNPLNATELGPIESSPANPEIVYLAGRLPGATGTGIMRSEDGGLSWSPLTLEGQFVFALRADPTDDQTVYASIVGGVFKSTDRGQHWTQLKPYSVWALAVDQQNPNIVYLGGPGQVDRSVDGGATWQELAPTQQLMPFWDVRALVVDATRPHSLYVALTGRGVREFSVEPNLEITGTGPSAVIPYGSTANYTYRARNIGPFDATNVRTAVDFPPDTTNVNATVPGGTCNVTGVHAVCTVPILRTGATVNISVGATHPIPIGNATVQAMVLGDQPDAANGNNSVATPIQVAQITDVSVALAGPAQATSGTAISYTLTVGNAGPHPTGSVSVSLQLDSRLTVSSVSTSNGSCGTTGGTISCTLANLADDATATITVSATSSTAGSYSSTATVDVLNVDPVSANDAATRVTTVNAPPSSGGGGSGGGGGGSVSPLLLMGLLLLSGARALRARARLQQ